MTATPEQRAHLLMWHRGDQVPSEAYPGLHAVGLIDCDGITGRGKAELLQAYREEDFARRRLVRRLIDCGAAMSVKLTGHADRKRDWATAAGRVVQAFKLGPQP